MREAGFTYAEIARKAGIPRTTIVSRMVRWGIKPKQHIVHQRRRPPTKNHHITRDELERLYWQDELSTVEIGTRYNLSANSINSLMRHYQIPRRDRGEAKRLAVRKASG